MKEKGTSLKGIEISYISFESGDNEALIDCNIGRANNSKKSRFIISMSDLNKLISSLKKIINREVNIECHSVSSTSSFYQIDFKKSGLSKIDLSHFFFNNSVTQIIA